MRHLPLMGGLPSILPTSELQTGRQSWGRQFWVGASSGLPTLFFHFILGGFIFYSCFFWISCPICLSMILMSFEICFLSMYSCFLFDFPVFFIDLFVLVWFSCFFRLIFLSARLSVNGRGLKVAISSSTLFQHFPHILAPCATIQPKI